MNHGKSLTVLVGRGLRCVHVWPAGWAVGPLATTRLETDDLKVPCQDVRHHESWEVSDGVGRERVKVRSLLTGWLSSVTTGHCDQSFIRDKAVNDKLDTSQCRTASDEARVAEVVDQAWA
ncbi:hypothetical protein RRG08_015554 [Elysia crispata]|uniref:Uncharacterized protein n=1 Tax=Elysia crispata TaxID=231223 RepID=A0AAE0YJY7_9GAST|nr:hypothetical protein RRG08_015554 [Elysia crispata]